MVSTCFVAFCWKGGRDGPKIGFTAPRALGKAALRNRMRRRIRETVRRRLWQVGPDWWIVFNIRRASLTAPQAALDEAVERVVERCKD